MSELTQRRHLAALGRCAMFSGLDDAGRRCILDAGRIVTRRKGEGIVTPMQPAEALFVVLAGRVKVFQLSARGDEQILHLFNAGETFGEAAVLTAGRYPAFAQAVQATILLELRRSTLRRILTGNGDLAMGMLAGLAVKLREFAATIERLSLKDVPARLASALAAEASAAGSDSFILSMTKRQLASRIGAAPETLSRALAKLKAQGLIEVRGSRITLRDASGLRRLATEA